LQLKARITSLETALVETNAASESGAVKYEDFAALQKRTRDAEARNRGLIAQLREMRERSANNGSLRDQGGEFFIFLI
jgi:hypothetical protein